ncbi:hypothetical protein Tco_0954057 [Tanacetum coccineum]|uniref:Uncharacterized protein n=1 Tax=Tanacetum coccineum TaxID=301880 RepID=A0ABQ5E1Q1_9ASTR
MSVENVSSGLVPQGQKASDYDNSDPVPPRQNVVPIAEKTDSSQQGLGFSLVLYLKNITIQHTVMLRTTTMIKHRMHHFKKLNLSILFIHGYNKLEGFNVAHQKGSLDPYHPETAPSEERFVWIKASSNSLVPCNMGLWYPKDSGFELTAFSDADHAICLDTRKSTSGGIQFLGDKLVSWMSKKQNCTAMSLAEAEYVALSASCAQVMWMRTQLQDYGFNYNKIPLYCDSQSAIAISCNPVQHSRTKHIHTRYHFIKEQVENALPEDWFKYLVRRIGMRCLTPADLEVLTNETA